MGVPLEELERRVAHMRDEGEHVDFLEKTASLIGRGLDRGVPPEQREGMAASLEALVRTNRALRRTGGATPAPGELEAEAALEALVARLR